MGYQEKRAHPRKALKEARNVQKELDRRVFYLRTLYDVSKDIYGSVESETILRNLLLISMGNFGVMEGFAILITPSAGDIDQFVSVGMQDRDIQSIRSFRSQLAEFYDDDCVTVDAALLNKQFSLATRVEYAMPFTVESDCCGLLGLGPKMIGEPYTDKDKELLDTLVNNLVIALKNARSFEKINRLNLDLQAKNAELETTLHELKAAMRKIELLERIKSNLGKFVPATVRSYIEQSPMGMIPENKMQDVSVLFLDIEGYTRICENLEDTEVNKMIEKCFSVFLDAIYANNGDVNETAGDGLMVIYLSDDETTNALEAVKTAMMIRKEAVCISKEFKNLPLPLAINMGINSGQALVGAAKFESITGSRWTYTARGSTTNVAARIGALATGGRVYLSEETAARVKTYFTPHFVSKLKLKNVSQEVSIFEV